MTVKTRSPGTTQAVLIYLRGLGEKDTDMSSIAGNLGISNTTAMQCLINLERAGDVEMPKENGRYRIRISREGRYESD